MSHYPQTPSEIPAAFVVPVAAMILKTVYQRRRDRLNLVLDTFDDKHIGTMTRLWETVSAVYSDKEDALGIFIQVLEADLEDGPLPISLLYPDSP